MGASYSRTWVTAADHFARTADEPLLTLMGAAHSLAADPGSPDAARLADSVARNAALLARMVQDLQRIARRSAATQRREMLEVIPVLRAALGAGNVCVDGDDSLIAIAAPADLTAFVEAIASAADGKTMTIEARSDKSTIRVTIRTTFPDRPLDVPLIRSLAAPLGPVAIGVDGSVTVSLPALRLEPAAATSGARWRAR